MIQRITRRTRKPVGGRPQSAQLGRWLRQCRPRPPPVGASDMVVRAKSSSRRCGEPYSVDTCGSLGPAPARSGRPEVAGVAYVIASVITASGDGPRSGRGTWLFHRDPSFPCNVVP